MNLTPEYISSLNIDKYIDFILNIYQRLSSLKELPSLATKLTETNSFLIKQCKLLESNPNLRLKTPISQIKKDINNLEKEISKYKDVFEYLYKFDSYSNNEELIKAVENDDLTNKVFEEFHIKISGITSSLESEFSDNTNDVLIELIEEFKSNPNDQENFLKIKINEYLNHEFNFIDQIVNGEFIANLNQKTVLFALVCDLEIMFIIKKIYQILNDKTLLQEVTKNPQRLLTPKPMTWNYDTQDIGAMFGRFIEEGVITSKNNQNTANWLATIFENLNASTLPKSIGLGKIESRGTVPYDPILVEKVDSLITYLKERSNK